MNNKEHKPGCTANIVCAVVHPDGICPGPYGKCTCGVEGLSNVNLQARPSNEIGSITHHTPDWEKEFDSAFYWIDSEKERCRAMYGFTSDTLKNYIRNLLTSQRAELVGKVKDQAIPAQNCHSIMVVPLNPLLDSLQDTNTTN